MHLTNDIASSSKTRSAVKATYHCDTFFKLKYFNLVVTWKHDVILLKEAINKRYGEMAEEKYKDKSETLYLEEKEDFSIYEVFIKM